MDLLDELLRVDRTVGEGLLASGPARAVTLGRAIDAVVGDVWDAFTHQDQLHQWWGPVGGQLRLGGVFSVPGQCSGTVQVCVPRHRIQVTWHTATDHHRSLGGLVNVELRPLGPRTQLRLSQISAVPDLVWRQYGPGGLAVSWDVALLALGAHLAGIPIGDVAELLADPDLRDVIARSSDAWGEAAVAAGAPVTQATRAAAATSAFYVPPVDA